MKKTLALVLALVLMIGMLAGCKSGSETQESNPVGTGQTDPNQGTGDKTETGASGGKTDSVVISVAADPVTLFPWGSANEGRNVTRMITYETLCFKDQDMNIVNCLAKEITEVDEKTFDIELYDYIYDTAGNQMTASDICFSLDLCIEDGNNASSVAPLESYEAISDYVVRLTFSDATAGCLDQITTQIYMVTEAGWEQSGDGMQLNPIGTSPYKLTDYVTGSYYEYTRTGNYWQKDESLVCVRSMDNVEKVTYRIITDKSTAAIALENGEIDSALTLKSEDFGNFVDTENGYTARSGYNSKLVAAMAITHLTFNCSDNSPCADENLRKAIASCIDTETIAYAVSGGLGRAPMAFALESMTDYDPVVEEGPYYNYEESNEQALAYLEASSYSGQTLKMLVNPEVDSKIAPLVQAYCDAIGIKIELLTYESALYNSYHQTDDAAMYDIDLALPPSGSYMWGKCGELDVDNYTNGLNHCFINDAELNEIYAAAKYLPYDISETSALIDYIDEHVFMYGIYVPKNLVVASDKFETIVTNHTNWIVPGACTYTR